MSRSRLAVLLAALLCPVAGACLAPSEATDAQGSHVEEGVILNVSLKTKLQGSYLSAIDGGGGALRATATAAQDWERFAIIKKDGGGPVLQHGDLVFLRTVGGKYLQAKDGGGGEVNAASPNKLDWETFRIVREAGSGTLRQGDVVGLQSVSGKFVSAENGGGGAVYAYGAALGDWERFVIELGGDLPPVPPPPPPPPPPGGGGDSELGPNVIVLDPSMGMDAIQARLNEISDRQEGNQFGDERYAVLFKPGKYGDNLDVKVGFYTEVMGLGASPDDVAITGAVRARADWWPGNKQNGTHNFWRGVSNLAIKPSPSIDNGENRWHVSQATHIRRVHLQGSLALSYTGCPNFDDCGWASGGFIADSVIDRVRPVSQQQWLTRNSNVSWESSPGAWNMVFVGVDGAPAPNWPANRNASGVAPTTVVGAAPRIREKPYLHLDAAGKYAVTVPALQANSHGASWLAGSPPGKELALDTFYIAHPNDTAASINAALAQGKNILFTPGIYNLSEPLQVTTPDTILMGLGMATLVAGSGEPLLKLGDVDGLTVSGLILDAGSTRTPTLLEVGPPGSAKAHEKDPTALFDVHCRVGGPERSENATTESCVTINSNDVIIDHMWLWRADHNYTQNWHYQWDKFKANNGITVNGGHVTAYGLFVEHFEQYQTHWKGNDGEVYFYQSELPYEADSQDQWKGPNGQNGYPSFKVADSVRKFHGEGLGIYAFFQKPGVSEHNAIEFPRGVQMKHMMTLKLGGNSAIDHIYNGEGPSASAPSNGAFSAE